MAEVYGTWLDIRGSWLRQGNFDNIYTAGGPNFTTLIPGAPKPPSGFGMGCRGVVSADHKTISLDINTLATGVRVATGQAFPTVYAPTTQPYRWSAYWRYSTVVTTNPAGLSNAQWSSERAQFLVARQPRGALYWSANWQNSAPVNGRLTLFSDNLPENVQWIRIELKGEGLNAVTPVYTYLPFQQLVPRFRPMAVRKSGVHRTLDRPSGFINIRKGGTWRATEGMLEAEANQPNMGSHRIRKNGVWVGQSKVGVQ